MVLINNCSGPAYQQANSLNTHPNDGGRLPVQQGIPEVLGIVQDLSGSTPESIDISQRLITVTTRQASYSYKLPFTEDSYKVVTEEFTYDDGSPGLRLKEIDSDEYFLMCSVPFSRALNLKRIYIEPDFDEKKHENTLMLVKNYSENEGCLDFLVENNIVKVVGEAQAQFVDFPIVQLIKREASSYSFMESLLPDLN